MSILACMSTVISKACKTDDPPHTCGTYRHAHIQTHTHNFSGNNFWLVRPIYAQYTGRSFTQQISVTCPLLLSPLKPCENLSELKKILLNHGNMNICLWQKKKMSVFFFLIQMGRLLNTTLTSGAVNSGTVEPKPT